MSEPEVIAVPIDVAVRLSGVGRSSLYKEIKKGNLKIVKIGRRSVVPMAQLRRLLASKLEEAE